MTKATTVEIPQSQGSQSLQTLLGVLLVVTFLEWCIFFSRASIPKFGAVPVLLALSAVKFLMVMDWYTRQETAPSLLARITTTTLVVMGGTALVFAAL